jgi:toxin ParE1/3/4
MQASYHPRVDGEVTEIAWQYDSERVGLGDEFLAELDEAGKTMLKLGARIRPVHKDIRAIFLDRFPYGIYYRVIGDTARVLVVKHVRRDLRYGLDRR